MMGISLSIISTLKLIYDMMFGTICVVYGLSLIYFTMPVGFCLTSNIHLKRYYTQNLGFLGKKFLMVSLKSKV